MSFEVGQTAIIVAVPEAEPVVHRWRERYDNAARLGVPAHITVLYPFLDVALIDDAVIERLGRIFGRQPALEVHLRRCGRFPGVLYLKPEPSEPFRRLTVAITEQWPQALPYGGVHDTIVPHLTVAHGADDSTLALVQRDVETRLPVSGDVTAAQLLSFDGQRWSPHARIPFGTPSAR